MDFDKNFKFNKIADVNVSVLKCSYTINVVTTIIVTINVIKNQISPLKTFK